MNLVPIQRMENGLNSLFNDVTLQFNCSTTPTTAATSQEIPQRRTEAVDDGNKTRGLNNFIDEKIEKEPFFRTQSMEFRPSVYDNSNDGSEDDDDDEDEEDEDEGDGEIEGLVVEEDDDKKKKKKKKMNNNSSGSVDSSSEKICNERSNLQEHHSFFGNLGLSKGMLVKDHIQSGNNNRGSCSSEEQHQHQGRVCGVYDNAITIAVPDNYYSQFIQGTEGGNMVHKVTEGGENGCGFSGRNDVSMSKESGESLRAILSDPLTGSLMDDAVILPCGHSFGSGGMQHVIRTKSCYTCSQSVSEESVAQNLSLRSAVQAFRREEELQSQRASKRRRERFEQNKCNNHDPFSMERMDNSRGKGVQFPFAVTDRVVIKGNKRVPLRFVGREAVVTTQCLNGWYVVKTVDNAESVKLQYRSLARVSDNPSSHILSIKAAPSWL
ncbi:hypothetical protein C5167_045352 [Papaver somniferum]|uniref:U-box domain-containing protein n=1 Tax=Papaver somniferum TaxID=3469 RepID=A0A4Y7LEC2_PAPSO|nr:U-box domain-containing protein 62-like [Papaver somniferum]RZC82569.1 hypothetical protein C5167_045352 [Papaver somniferum]